MARQTLERNVKFKTLVKTLKLAKPYVRGLLETMWDVAHECGNPVIGTAEDVEMAAEWPGKPGTFVAALKKVRLIDELPNGNYEIHHYWHHCPNYVKDRRRKEDERHKDKDGNSYQNSGSSLRQIDCNDDSRNNNHLRSDCPGNSGISPNISTTPSPSPLLYISEGSEAPDPKPAIQSFEEWSMKDRGQPLDTGANEARPITNLVAALSQSPPIIRDNERINCALMIPLAVELAKKRGVRFEGPAYAARVVKGDIEKWQRTGIPGTNQSTGPPKIRIPPTLTKAIKHAD